MKAGLLAGTGLGLGLAGIGAADSRPGATVYKNNDSGDFGWISGHKVSDLTGHKQTGQFAAPWSDLGIPTLCPDGTMFLVGGDTFDGTGHGAMFGGYDWRSPVGLRSSTTDLRNLKIDGSVGGSHAIQLLPEGHAQLPGGMSTLVPSDAFTIGNTMYMHVLRGPLYFSSQSELWQSTDNGETWGYLCSWPADMYDSQFQQKSYAVADDGYCYVASARYNRRVASGILLSRVRHEEVGNPQAYEPWGHNGEAWGWGSPPSTITRPKVMQEICFRSMDGKYVLTWVNVRPSAIRAQVFDQPTADLWETPEQTLILPARPGEEAANRVTKPYGGFVVPGSTIDDFHLVVSQWYPGHPPPGKVPSRRQVYRIMHYAIEGLRA